MKEINWKITNENLLDLINDLSESKLSAQTKIYNSVDIKASWIILFLWAIIAFLFNSNMTIVYVVSSILFVLSITFSIVVIRPRKLKLGVNLSWLTKKYRNQNESKNSVLKEIVWNINDSTDSNGKLIELKSKRLKRSLIMLSIWIWVIVIYNLSIYFYNVINLILCLKIAN